MVEFGAGGVGCRKNPNNQTDHKHEQGT
jgi:hypothetical protein